MPAEPCVLVGRDVFAYTLTEFGQECNPGAGTTPVTYNMLGRWRNVSFEIEPNWVDTTSSSEFFVRRRRTTYDFRVTLEGLVEMIGSVPLILNEDCNLVKVVFTEISGGGVITCIGGISRVTYRGQREEFTDTLELQCAGDVLGDGQPFTYTPSSTTTLTGADAGLREAIKAMNEAVSRSAAGKKAA